jgi:hypothetical protein
LRRSSDSIEQTMSLLTERGCAERISERATWRRFRIHHAGLCRLVADRACVMRGQGGVLLRSRFSRGGMLVQESHFGRIFCSKIAGESTRKPAPTVYARARCRHLHPDQPMDEASHPNEQELRALGDISAGSSNFANDGPSPDWPVTYYDLKCTPDSRRD